MSTSAIRRLPGTSLFASPPRAAHPAAAPSDRSPTKPLLERIRDSHSYQSHSQEQADIRRAHSQGELAEGPSITGTSEFTRTTSATPLTMASPSLKRSHSAVSEAAEGGDGGESATGQRSRPSLPGRDTAHGPPSSGSGLSKVPRLDRGSEDVAASQRALSSEEDDTVHEGDQPGRPPPVDRNYIWQSTSRSGGDNRPGIPFSPSNRGLPPLAESGRRAITPGTHLPPPTLPSPGRHGRTRLMDNRLPGFASLQRPNSPPPQVARYHAERSFVSANPSVGGVSGAGRSLAHFQPGHSQGSPHSSLPHSYSGHQAGQGGTSPLMASASAMQGCPPIHPSLMGIPGSGTGPGNKQQPSFVAKLYSMLEDDATSEMITWGPSGDVFSVANPSEFSRVILPAWFKHANWQSFVRQLNMYGFHKVNHTFSGTPNEEVQIWEFKHPSFRRGAIHLLSDIKRKSSRHKRTGSQSQSFSGSLHGTDFDGRRSRSSTPMEGYGMNEPPFHPGMPMHPGSQAAQQRYRPYPVEHDYSMSHSRVRSLTDATMRPPPRSFAQAGEMVGGAGGPGLMRSEGGAEHYKTPSMGGLSGGGPLGPPAVLQAGPSDVYGKEDAPFAAQSPQGRIKDLSDRVDAIIRHSNYLEDQVRFLSDQLHNMEQHDRTVATHLTRSISRLTHVCALGEPGPETSAQDLAAIRGRSLDLVYDEIHRLNAILMLEPETLSPNVASRREAEAGPSNAPPVSARNPVGRPMPSSPRNLGQGTPVDLRGGATSASGPSTMSGSHPSQREMPGASGPLHAKTESERQERPGSPFSFPRR